MARFSANLGFLWTDVPLPDAIRRAAAAGFEAVECHFPFDVDTAAVNAALDETGLLMLGLNTTRGDTAAGDFGLSALKGREEEARAAITQAIDYAHTIGCQNVHVMAGKGGDERTFLSNLAFAAYEARDLNIG
ncbi:MAG: TIM barrel protein, partial [Paracoccaceae bacterium]|nr:TIM barrel protein [Paracoccaceae bacterium]